MDALDLPERPLTVKCTFDKSNKRINFSTARNCSYDVLKEKVEKCFSLKSFLISWKDDDGEITHILSDHDLADAIHYYSEGDDAPLSSAASILSGRSFGLKKITVKVSITVDYDGPSLSDTSSLASMDEYRNRNGSRRSFSFSSSGVSGAGELDDDAVTVSSKDHMAPSTSGSNSNPWVGDNDHTKTSPTVQYRPQSSNWDLADPSSSSGSLRTPSSHGKEREREPSGVFARLKLREELGDGESDWHSTQGKDDMVDSRGAQWLREQNEHVIRSRLGALPEPSISSSENGPFSEALSGDLSLQRNDSGRYYYTYNASASGSGSVNHVSADEYSADGDGEDNDVFSTSDGKAKLIMNRPNSRHLDWVVDQQQHLKMQSSSSPRLSVTDPSPSLYTDDDRALYNQLTSPPPLILTDCNMCGVLLNSIRYVCATCGEKPPLNSRPNPPAFGYTYPPGSSPQSQYNGGGNASTASLSPRGWASAMSSHTQLNPPTPQGYELCADCFQDCGIHHAVEAGLYSPMSPSSTSTLSLSSMWKRTAPGKGQNRHAFQEKLWGDFGWEDVAQDESVVSRCTICDVITTSQRYKCAACPSFHLCRACYSLVHDIHPNDAFILVKDAPPRTIASDTSTTPVLGVLGDSDEQSLSHGVSCSHCLRSIVGARFHCAICQSVDICSSCEAAGLPGNLHSADGGHDSSHILIKIPFPLEGREVDNASRRALHLWNGRDAADVLLSSSRIDLHAETLYAPTVVPGGNSALGSNTMTDSHADHGMGCNNCGKHIRGVRYQCAHCPSQPKSYNLCSMCEPKSWMVHDPRHIFFKLPRPLEDPRLLESSSPFLPILYDVPAGPPPSTRHRMADHPRDYLRTLKHKIALCDKCSQHIEGEWFRCANCSIDRCERCESVDTHAPDHIFIVIKSTVNLQAFKSFTDPHYPTPILASPVYTTSRTHSM